MKPADQYEVSREGQRVLLFSDEPGVLMSTGVRPPGFTPPAHPFLNGQALDAKHEHVLAQLLARARSTGEFITLLRQQGFDVQRQTP